MRLTQRAADKWYSPRFWAFFLASGLYCFQALTASRPLAANASRKSFHAGFSNLSYFYSESGSQTLVVSSYLDGAPPAMGKPDFEKLAVLEAQLPLAKDGTRFKYKNSFRCPHCGAAYIDFERFPNLRETEYYGNYFYGDEIAKFEPEKQKGG